MKVIGHIRVSKENWDYLSQFSQERGLEFIQICWISFFERMNLPTQEEKILIYTDGNIQYSIYLPEL